MLVLQGGGGGGALSRTPRELSHLAWLSLFSSPSTLRHPNLVCLIGVSLDELPIYLITEYMAKVSKSAHSFQSTVRCSFQFQGFQLGSECCPVHA